MRLWLISPERTSSGGSAFTSSLLPELERRIDGAEVTLVSAPPVGRMQLPEGEPTHVVFLGSRAERVGAAKVVFWPLNVAPLEQHVVNLTSSTLRNKARHRLLKHRLGRSVQAADGLVFGSFHARTLYMSEFDAAARLPYLVSRGGAPSLEGPASDARPAGDDRSPLVLAVSHLYPYKGILELVQALGVMRTHLPDGLRVRVAGADRDIRYAARVRAAIAETGLGDIVTVAPASPEEMAELYRAATLMVFPSTCENAGSFALYDGLHAGIPTICSDRSSMPEMVGDATRLVNPFDADDLGSAVVDLLGDPGKCADLADRARRWSASAQTWERRADELVTFLEEHVS